MRLFENVSILSSYDIVSKQLIQCPEEKCGKLIDALYVEVGLRKARSEEVINKPSLTEP